MLDLTSLFGTVFTTIDFSFTGFIFIIGFALRLTLGLVTVSIDSIDSALIFSYLLLGLVFSFVTLGFTTLEIMFYWSTFRLCLRFHCNSL
jgi:hypothetical protein